MNRIAQYLQALNAQLASGRATEHSYRPALQALLETLLPLHQITNEPIRTAAGAPDYIITNAHSQAPIAYVEAKDIGDSDLHGRNQHKEQFDRYKHAFGTILFTDYLRFYLYQDHALIASATIGELSGRGIIPTSQGFDQLQELIAFLAAAAAQPARSARELAGRMAAKAQLLAHAIHHSLTLNQHTAIQDQLQALKEVLLHDVTHKEFADLYAQTITYGLFAARLQQAPYAPFSRQHAATLIPKTNPFLRQIFQQIAGYDLDPHLEWIVDAIVQLLAITDVPTLMEAHQAAQREPIAHFYEDFLAAYDPKVRRQRGVWYTPAPIVRFIVQATDHILRSLFDLPLGLADTSTIQGHHRVQILDPAVGTGTFLSSIVKHIHQQLAHQAGAWTDYVNRHLLPRLHGFELLMAPYAIAHLQLDLLLRYTGWKPSDNHTQRIGIYLTNALEEHHPDTYTLFAKWLSDEANRANRIKRKAPVMVMLGNPPYSISSRNKGEWIMRLIQDYKQGLNERNIQPLSDDYIKFIRLAQHFISRTGEGIVAFITNNSYLDGLIHRQMRHALRKAFDLIYILDLHGNLRRSDSQKPSGKDENLFAIMTGISICFLIKQPNANTNELATVFHHELRGSATQKCEFLETYPFAKIPWQQLNPIPPHHFFVPKDFSLQEEYEKGFRMDELFISYSMGITTSRDRLNVQYTPADAEALRQDALTLDTESFRQKHSAGDDSRDWSAERAQADVRTHNEHLVIAPYAYRPFDTRYIIYTGKTNGIVAWPRSRSLNFLRHPANYAICCIRANRDSQLYPYICDTLPDKTLLSPKDNLSAFSLYTQSSINQANPLALTEPLLNMHPDLLERIGSRLAEKIEPIELMDYIYAVLHSQRYQARYEEFLRIEFPRIPYPADPTEYHRLANLGRSLRALHLLYRASTWQTNTRFAHTGSNLVEHVDWKDGKVHINESQCFDGVPHAAWLHYVGGYQPAQKWLKDRISRTLTYDDVQRYAQLIHALHRTAQIVLQIDTPKQ